MTTFARFLRLLFCLLLLQPGLLLATGSDAGCEGYVGQWIDPANGDRLQSEQLFDRLARSPVVLLGEAHTSRAHHRWQHYMLSALHSRKTNMIVGFEMLPRRAQTALDAWSAGNLSEAEFLEQSDWQKVWSYDASLYLPLLHFARLNRLPTVALNVDRELVSLVGQQGWQSLDEEQRMGLSDPAPASAAYRQSLAELYAYKQSFSGKANHTESDDAVPDLEEIKASAGFANFVDAQLTWDRAMAEALAAAHRRDPDAILVGIVGRGHVEYGYGIPHQLEDMGIDGVELLLPIDTEESCESLPADLASAVFVVDVEQQETPAPRPRLGVFIEAGDGGVRVMQVVDDSVAAATGIEQGDLILAAAGFEVDTSTALIEIIQRQAPGTWLPLKILRGDSELDLLARFPQSFE
jgi:uncharacterized iron-regulated protein